MIVANDKSCCKNCHKSLQGRSDKKFCNDYCRSAHNNKLRSPVNNLIRNINHTLGKNRRILCDFIQEDKDHVKVSREKLIQKGFEFKYFTHSINGRKGDAYFFCYDLGYVPLQNDLFLLVRKHDDLKM